MCVSGFGPAIEGGALDCKGNRDRQVKLMPRSKPRQNPRAPAAENGQVKEIVKTMISIAIARDLTSPSLSQPTACETGCLSAIALGVANLRLGLGDAELDFLEVYGLSANGFFAELEGTISCGDEADLLNAATRLIEVPPSPLLVTWNGSTDIPYLRSRAFAGKRRADWLFNASLPGTEELVSTHHLDISQYLFPEGFSIPIEQALLEIGVPCDPAIKGLARLEITACGLLFLAAKAFWFRGEISADAYGRFLGSFTERARHLAASRPHFGIFISEEDSKSDQQQ